MEKNLIQTDGFLEVRNKKHLQDFSKLTFLDLPFVPLKKIHAVQAVSSFNFRIHQGICGVYILKEKQSNKIFSIGGGQDLYSRICSVVYKRKTIDFINDAELVVIRGVEPLLPQIITQVKSLHRRVQECTVYEAFQSCIEKGEPLPLELLTFKSLYEPYRIRPVFSFKHLIHVPGVYVIMENSKIVYVGMGGKQVSKALYQHFLKAGKDRDTSHYRANYFFTREQFEYQVAIIETPWLGKSSKEIEKIALALEKYLILYLDPLDNRKGVVTDADLFPLQTIALDELVSIEALLPHQNPF